MRNFLKNYKAIGLGLIITLIFSQVVIVGQLFRIQTEFNLENIVLFLLWWLSISLMFHNFSYLRTHRFAILKLFLLLLFLLLLILLEEFFKVSALLTFFPLVILSGFLLLIILLPKYLKKYQIPVVLVYGSILIYSFYLQNYPSHFHNPQERISNLILGSIPLLLCFWGLEQWKWLKTLKAEKLKAELGLLKIQVNPHFYFNTLNNLYGLTVEKSDDAPELVLKLSEVMRYTIYEGKKDLVSLESEIEYLKSYIALHRIRYQHELRVSLNVHLKRDHQVAPLLFIILLENAFKHGAEKLTEVAFIHIDFSESVNKLRFEIENNFDGDVKPQKPGIGLQNLKQRLDLLYPNNYTFQIQKNETIYKAILEIPTV